MKLVHISRKNEESTRSANSPSNEDDTTVTKEDSSAVDELQSGKQPLRSLSLQHEQKSRGNTIPPSNDSVMITTSMPSGVKTKTDHTTQSVLKLLTFAAVQHETKENITPQIKATCKSCSECGKVYQHRGSLYKHMKSEHPHLSEGSITCHEHKCTFSCQSLAKLRCHLSDEHGILMEDETINFRTYHGTVVNPSHVIMCSLHHNNNIQIQCLRQ